MKPARKVTARSRISRRGTPLTLSQRVERLERELLFKAVKTATEKASARFINLGTDGKPTTDDHVAVAQPSMALIWAAAPIGGNDGLTHADAAKAAASLNLLGHKDWRLPTIQELLSIVDYERWNPAVDPKHFKGPYGYTWTSTLVKGEGAPSGFARVVVLGNGDSSWLHQDDHNRALAVRACQQIGLLG